MPNYKSIYILSAQAQYNHYEFQYSVHFSSFTKIKKNGSSKIFQKIILRVAIWGTFVLKLVLCFSFPLKQIQKGTNVPWNGGKQ